MVILKVILLNKYPRFIHNDAYTLCGQICVSSGYVFCQYDILSPNLLDQRLSDMDPSRPRRFPPGQSYQAGRARRCPVGWPGADVKPLMDPSASYPNTTWGGALPCDPSVLTASRFVLQFAQSAECFWPFFHFCTFIGGLVSQLGECLFVYILALKSCFLWGQPARRLFPASDPPDQTFLFSAHPAGNWTVTCFWLSGCAKMGQ